MSSSASSRAGFIQPDFKSENASQPQTPQSTKATARTWPLTSQLKLSDYTLEADKEFYLLSSHRHNLYLVMEKNTPEALETLDDTPFIVKLENTISCEPFVKLVNHRIVEIKLGLTNTFYQYDLPEIECNLKEALNNITAEQVNDFSPKGGFLHSCFVNEMNPYFINFIIQELSKKNIKINLNTVDFDNRTALIMACKLRNPNYVSLLMPLIEKNDPLFKARDKQGFSALDYALALGSQEIFDLLRPHFTKAEIQESLGKALDVSEEGIIDIFCSVSLHPFRDSGALANAVTYTYFMPYLAVDSLAHLNTQANFRKIFSGSLDQYPKSIQEQAQRYTGRSLLDACLNQRSVLHRRLFRLDVSQETKPNLNAFFSATISEAQRILAQPQRFNIHFPLKVG